MTTGGRQVTEYGPIETVDARRRVVPLFVFGGVVALLLWASVDGLGARVLEHQSAVVIPQVDVPSVAGTSRAKATTRIEAAGLEVEFLELANDKVPKGDVFAQIPGAGTKLSAGSVVQLIVSQGPAQLVVPDATGQQYQDAQKVVLASGLVPQPVARYDETVRPGEVVETFPSPGSTLAAGGTVQLIVSGGKSPRVVPQLIGMPSGEALNLLGRTGLGVGTIKDKYTGAPAGTVLEVDPKPGSVLQRDAPVSLVVTGDPAKVEVPSVAGLREDDAVEKLQSAGLKVEVLSWFVEYGSAESGRVVRQGTPALALVEPGFKVELYIGQPLDPPTTLPPVTVATTAPTTIVQTPSTVVITTPTSIVTRTSVVTVPTSATTTTVR